MLRTAFLALLLAGCMVGEDSNGLPVGGDPDPVADPDPEPEVPTGSIMMSGTTAPQGTAGGFEPFNAVAVWVEDAQGNFVKTIERLSAVRTQHLVAWNQAAGVGDTDSVSGASRANHTPPLSLEWKLKDRNKQVIPDGTYTIRVEVTEVNAIAAAENQQATFTFTKGLQAETQTALTNGGMTNVSITFTPPP